MDTGFYDLPFEVYYNIGLELSYKELILNCTISKKFAELCRNGLFWKLKSIHDFKISEDDYNTYLRQTGSDRETYVYIAGIRNVPIDGAERYGTIKILIKNALKVHDYDLFWKFFKMHPDEKVFIDVGTTDIKTSKELIDRAAKAYPRLSREIINNAFMGAAWVGNIELMSHLMSLGAYDLRQAMGYAARGGHIEALEMLFPKIKADT